MAVRPIFKPKKGFYEEELIEFEWIKGMSFSQKQKRIKEFHNSIQEQYPEKKIVDISTKSLVDIGKELSAFNLMFRSKGKKINVENAYQNSKRFLSDHEVEHEADKKNNKHKNFKRSEKVIEFHFEGKTYENKPKTMFYDWLYLKALNENKRLHEKVIQYDIFTDIEFNPKKSINCQARAVAIFVALWHEKKIKEVLSDYETFKKFYISQYRKCKYNEDEQLSLDLKT